MEIGIVGLGKMGMNLSLNMLDHQVDVKAYDTSEMQPHSCHPLIHGQNAFLHWKRWSKILKPLEKFG